MTVNAKFTGNTLYIFLCGELDEYNARSVREQTDALLDRYAACERAVFDLSGVKFMDSAGIGFLIGRYKRLKKYGMGMFLENPNTGADKILQLSGLYSLMPKI